MNYKRLFSKLTTKLTNFTSSPIGLIFALLTSILGLALAFVFKFDDVYMLALNLFLSEISYLLLFVIQASQSRDTKTLNTRIDYLIHVSEVPDDLIQLEEQEDKKIEEIRDKLKDFKPEQ